MRIGSRKPSSSSLWSSGRFTVNESTRRKLIETVSVRSARRLIWNETWRASTMPSQAMRSAPISRASAPRGPSTTSSGGAKPSAQRRPLSVPSSQPAAATSRMRSATQARRSHFITA